MDCREKTELSNGQPSLSWLAFIASTKYLHMENECNHLGVNAWNMEVDQSTEQPKSHKAVMTLGVC